MCMWVSVCAHMQAYLEIYRNVDLSKVRKKMPYCLIDPGACILLREVKDRCNAKPSTCQAEMVLHHVATLGTEGREDSQEGQGLYRLRQPTVPCFFGNTRKPGLDGVVSFPFCGPDWAVHFGQPCVEHEAPPRERHLCVPATLNLDCGEVCHRLALGKVALGVMPKLLGTVPASAPLGSPVVFVAQA